MMEEPQTKTMEITDPELVILKREEEGGLDYRERRHDDWTQNYALARDKVIINRLTQRQTVNIPLVKYVLNSLLKEMTDAPQLYFSNLDNDEQKEIFYNEHWKEIFRRNKLTIKDHIDKKQNALFGRSFKLLNIVDGRVVVSLVDPQDVIVNRYTDPSDIDSTPCLTIVGQWTPLREILEEKEYIQSEVKRLASSLSEESGTQESEENFQKASEKADRMRIMGDIHVLDPVLGETYVDLHQTFRMETDKKSGETCFYRYILASTKSGLFKLHKAPLHTILGETADDFWYNHLPLSSWASDPESTDFWSDGVVDVIRPINNVLNVWISQLVENRTLQNFSMKYYDSTVKNFVPQTFQPQAWAHFPVPGDPNKIIKDVQAGNLTGTLEELTFLIDIAKQATAATNAQGGETTSNVTLGDVKLALANAQKRIMMQQVFYSEDWKDLGLKVTKLLEGAGDLLDPVTIFKKGRLGKKMYKKTISAKDWKTKSGYTVEIKTVSNKQQEDTESVQKLNVLKQEMADNVPLMEIYHKKLAEFAGLTPDEISQILEFEKQKGQNAAVAAGQGMDQNMQPVEAGGQGGIPQVPDIAPMGS